MKSFIIQMIHLICVFCDTVTIVFDPIVVVGGGGGGGRYMPGTDMRLFKDGAGGKWYGVSSKCCKILKYFQFLHVKLVLPKVARPINFDCLW